MARMKTRQEFRARLEAQGPGGAWTYIVLPFSVEKTWGSRALVSVKGSINGFGFRSSVFPAGDGTHTMMVNKAMQQGAGVGQGDTAEFVMEPDTAPRVVEAPPDLQKALSKNAAAKAFWDKCPPSHRKAYLGYIEEAKLAETRARRIEKTIATMAGGKKSK